MMDILKSISETIRDKEAAASSNTLEIAELQKVKEILKRDPELRMVLEVCETHSIIRWGFAK